MPNESEPIVAFPVEPGGPCIVIVPGPTNISFHGLLIVPSVYRFEEDGIKSAPIFIILSDVDNKFE
jgi:hypothetical protein